MLELFWLHLTLAFVVGSVWVTLTTVAAERFGSQVGGFIGGLPSTCVVSFFFIGLSQTPAVAAQSTTAFPLAYAFTGLFLVIYAVLARKSFLAGLAGALAAWFALSATVFLADVQSLALSLAVYVFGFGILYYVLVGRLRLAAAGGSRVRYTAGQLAGRAAFSGCVIAFVVWSSRAGGPMVGGIFSAFPAVFISTLVISYRVRGLEFSRAITRPLMTSGMVTIVVYALGVRYFYPALGLALGTLAAYGVSMLSALVTALAMQRNLV